MRDESRSAGLLRRLALSDEGTIGSIFSADITDLDNSELGEKTRASIRLAALIATESAAPSYQWAVNIALAAGMSEDEVAAVLMSVAPIVGVARVASAAPVIASALGYELDLPERR
jgi:alkylhydroperoxidase/carboxymuconolactone decarboxylase family protein YurZ